MNDRVFILRQSIVKLTQMLAGKGVRVTQQGVSAYVLADDTGRPIQVNLPYLPDNATEELIQAIQGFLDHEVAHILFTDFMVKGSLTDEGLASMLNLVEDCRIEREMAKRFQGSAFNLGNTRKFFLDKYVRPKMEEAAAGGDNEMLISVLTVPVVRALSGQPEMKDFIDANMGYAKPLYDKIKDEAKALEECESTADALKVAKSIMKKLRGTEEETPPKSGKGGKAAPSGGKPMPRPKAAAPKPPKDEDEDDGTSEEDDTDEEGEEAEGGAGTAGDDDDMKEAPEASRAEGAVADDDAEKDASSDGPMEVGFDAATWKAIEKELANDYDSSVSKEITDVTAGAAAESDYLVFTTDKDVIEPLHVGSGYNPTMLTTLQNKVDHMVGPMQKDLERAISARSLSVWATGMRSGRLHSANLARLAIKSPNGFDDRVFRRKHEQSSKDVAVELVVDISGSMSGSKVHTAVQSAYALASTLERIGIACEVICFTTGPMAANAAELEAEQKLIADKKSKGTVRYSRMESLYMPILKGFDERMGTEVKQRFGWMPNSGHMQSNVDGECVMVAGRRLLARRETGKVMIVLSDGYPAAHGDSRALNAHLKKVVKDLTKAGLNIIGIGIESEAVQSFYPKHLTLSNVEELPATVMKTLRGLIVQDAR